jgi:hypothetical protein
MLVLMLVQCLVVAVEAKAEVSGAVTTDSHHEMHHDAHSADTAVDIAAHSAGDHPANCDHCCQCHGHSHGSHLALLNRFFTSFPDTPSDALCRNLFAAVTGHIAAIYRPPIL